MLCMCFHLREIRFVQSLLPITSIVLETGTFDPHALKNPDVLHHKWLYQKGINYGFANTKAYVLTRDGYTCQQCEGKSKNQRLEVHHIIFVCKYRKSLLTRYGDETKRIFEVITTHSDFSFETMEAD